MAKRKPTKKANGKAKAPKARELSLNFFPGEWFQDRQSVRAFMSGRRGEDFFEALSALVMNAPGTRELHVWELVDDLHTLAKVAAEEGDGTEKLRPGRVSGEMEQRDALQLLAALGGAVAIEERHGAAPLQPGALFDLLSHYASKVPERLEALIAKARAAQPAAAGE